jgi:hypothetical protein
MNCKPFDRGARAVWIALALFWCCGVCRAEGQEPRLAVIGKTVNYRQAADGSLARLNYHFFAEIFLAPGSEAGTGRLIDPRGRVIAFKALGSILSISGGGNFSSLADLNAHVPDGTYHLQFDAPQTPPISGAIVLHATEGALADPVHLTLFQDGKPVSPAAVNIAKELTVAWAPFRKGRADPNGIIDDLIFVHVGDCHGKVIARTPAPFAESPALTYRAPSYIVAANTLEAGETYQISVEHAPVVTRKLGGMPALATYPATTFLDLRTTGASSNTCPDPPYRMDNGQTDRTLPANHITDQVTFLYYDDLAAPRKFYSQTLGLTPYFEKESVSLFRTAPGAAIGLVKVEHADTAPAVKRATVMVSIVTDDVAGWYARLRQDPSVHIVKPIYDHPQVPIRAFEMEDPGGYPVEFFQWLESPQAR